MKKFLQITLGILTAIGGFVDIGDLVANSQTGARFGMALAWVVVLGVLGISLYAEMAGRVVAVSKRPVFDLVRERLGAVMALGNLLASFLVNLLTITAEIAGVAIALQLATSVNYLLWLPLTALLVWLVIWRVKFETMERIFGFLGLTLVVVAVAVWRSHPGHVLAGALHPGVPKSESVVSYAYFAIALFGAAMTPYEVFFFSSGGVEEKWTSGDLSLERANVFVGFPLGGVLSLSLMAAAAIVFAPRNVSVDHLSQVALPTALALGRVGLALLIVGFFAATFGAALETALSAGYIVAQYFGWQWGKGVKPVEAPRFHVVVLLGIILSMGLALTSVDPVKVTGYSLVLSAATLPLTYFPILVIANDRDYMGDRTNSRLTNAAATVFLVVVVLASLAAIPLLVITRGG